MGSEEDLTSERPEQKPAAAMPDKEALAAAARMLDQEAAPKAAQAPEQVYVVGAVKISEQENVMEVFWRFLSIFLLLRAFRNFSPISLSLNSFRFFLSVLLLQDLFRVRSWLLVRSCIWYWSSAASLGESSPAL